MQDITDLIAIILGGILFIASCATPWILAIAMHTIN
jgi:hypothetical protein